MHKNEKSKLRALSDIASIDITFEFNEILQNILRITCEAMNAHSGTIMLVDEGNNELGMEASYGLPHDYIERVYELAKNTDMPITTSPSGVVLETGKCYQVPNVFEEPRDKPWAGLAKELGFSSQIFSPMKRGLKVIGLLNVYMAQVHQFTDEEIDFVTIAASQASSVVQNARICGKLKNNIVELNKYKEHLEDKIKKAYRQLYNSEKYLKTIIESTSNGIVVTNEQGNLEFVNSTFLKIFERSEDELIGHHFLKILSEDVHELALIHWNDVLNGGSNEDEIKIISKSGDVKYLRCFHALTEFEGQRKLVSITEDITEKRRLEQELDEYSKKLEKSYAELRESEERYRELFENASDMFLIGNKDGYVIDVNNATVRALGCTAKEEVIGTHFSEWYTPESIEIAFNNLKKYISGEPVKQPQILEVACKDGKHKWVEVRSRIIKEGDRAIAIHAIARDITEKLRLEEKLKESETLYRDLFENADDPMYTHNLKGYFLTVNKIGVKMLGGTEEEIIGSHISKWLTPQSLKIFEDRVMKISLNQPLEQPVVIEVINKDGEHKWGEARTRLIKDGTRITGVHGIVRDITEKMRLEKGFRESEAKYRDLFDNASDCIYTINLDGQFLTANNSVAKAMKCTSVEEVLVSNMSKWMTPESLEKAIKFIQEVVTEEDYYNKSVVIEIIRKDGKHVWFEHKARPLKDNNNNIIGLHGIGRDITEKIRLEQELKESEAKYRDLFENAQDVMYVLDTEGIVLKMNQVGLRNIGCTREEVIGNNISKWLTPDSVKIVEERRKKRLSGETVNQTDVLEVVSKNGEHRWVEIKIRDIRDCNRIIEIHGIARDITENMRLKQELNKSNKQRKLLCYLIEGTRGGKTRALILKHLVDRSLNAHQLSKALNMDYKTIRHHLDILVKNGVISRDNKGSSNLYFLSKNTEESLYLFSDEKNNYR